MMSLLSPMTPPSFDIPHIITFSFLLSGLGMNPTLIQTLLLSLFPLQFTERSGPSKVIRTNIVSLGPFRPPLLEANPTLPQWSRGPPPEEKSHWPGFNLLHWARPNLSASSSPLNSAKLCRAFWSYSIAFPRVFFRLMVSHPSIRAGGLHRTSPASPWPYAAVLSFLHPVKIP